MFWLYAHILLLFIGLFCYYPFAYASQPESIFLDLKDDGKLLLKRDLIDLPHDAPYSLPVFAKDKLVTQQKDQVRRYRPFKPVLDPPVSPVAFEKPKALTPESMGAQKDVHQEGKDRRERIKDVKGWPHRLHVSLSLIFDKDSVGTGTLIGPCHILTAGHNVYNKGRSWVRSIKVNLGLDENTCHFGRVDVRRVYVRKEWIEGHRQVNVSSIEHAPLGRI